MGMQHILIKGLINKINPRTSNFTERARFLKYYICRRPFYNSGQRLTLLKLMNKCGTESSCLFRLKGIKG